MRRRTQKTTQASSSAASSVYKRQHILLDTTHWSVYFSSIALGLFGMTLGYVLARVFKQDPNRSRTIAMETGIQNGPMAILIVTLSITGAIQQDVLLIPVLYSLFIVISSSIVAFFFRKLSTKESLARDQRKLGSMMSAR